jgi:hypothetical protein
MVALIFFPDPDEEVLLPQAASVIAAKPVIASEPKIYRFFMITFSLCARVCKRYYFME